MMEKSGPGGEEANLLTTMDLQGSTPLATQVGGHRFGKNGNKVGMLDKGNGIVLKALQAPPRGTRELWLYQKTYAKGCRDPQLLELRHFLPFYHGTQCMEGVKFLVLNNISHHFPKPNILDLKMGRVTYDPEATEKKKQHEIDKYPPLKELGFQITGMMIHDPKTGVAHHFPKTYCRSVTAETMLKDGLGKFFGLHDGGVRRDVVECLLSRLRRIERWFHIQRIFNFYASSLLIVYSSQEDMSRWSSVKTRPRVCVSTLKASTKATKPCASISPTPPRTVSSKPLSCPDIDEANPVCSTASDFGSVAENEEAMNVNMGSKQNSSKRRGSAEKKADVQGQSPTGTTQSRKRPAEELDTEFGEQKLASEAEGGLGLLKNKANQQGLSQPKHCKTDSHESQGDHGVPRSRRATSEDGQGFVKTKLDQALSSETKQTLANKTEAKVEEVENENVFKDKGEFILPNQTDDEVEITFNVDYSPMDVRMIDFAHVFPAVGKDCNYLFGLQKLMSLLEELLKM